MQNGGSLMGWIERRCGILKEVGILKEGWIQAKIGTAGL